VKTRLDRFDAKVQNTLNSINKYLEREQMSIEDLHKRLDTDRDGGVDRNEFIESLQELGIQGLHRQDLGSTFDALDANGDGAISVDELGLYLKGAQLTRAERENMMPQRMKDQINNEIRDLFKVFDTDGDGQVTAEEIGRTL